MRATIWGCRGSVASPGPETVRFGGNTSCVELELDDGSLVILDAGTGIRALGMRADIQQRRNIYLLLTHLHLDHLEGLGFFTPFWNPEVRMHIWGPASPVKSLAERIARYLSPPLFPVHLSDVPSTLVLQDAPDEPFTIGTATITAQHVSHAGPAVGYRIEERGRSLTYLPDHEPVHGGDLSGISPEWLSGYAIARGADLLLHDSQYTEKEYLDRIGWGHSSVEHVVEFAHIAEVKQLVMFHHDPMHTDEDLDAHGQRARELWGSDGSAPILAREGMQLEL